jgi:quinol monooxygenase YgiN
VPVIVVTRLRLKDPSLLDEFFNAAVALFEQATSSEGNLGADALAEANNTWWSCSAWRDRASMRSYVDTEPHRTTRARLDDWCDEATFGDWEQDESSLPDWQTAYRRLVDDGVSATLTDASEDNESRAFPAPVEATQ